MPMIPYSLAYTFGNGRGRIKRLHAKDCRLLSLSLQPQPLERLWWRCRHPPMGGGVEAVKSAVSSEDVFSLHSRLKAHVKPAISPPATHFHSHNNFITGPNTTHPLGVRSIDDRSPRLFQLWRYSRRLFR